MFILLLLLLGLAAGMSYMLFAPAKTKWNEDMYEKPQSFTDEGLEAEWGTPPGPMKSPPNTPPRDHIMMSPPSLPRRELADMIHSKLCLQGCVYLTYAKKEWSCTCGMVSNYANPDN